VGRKVSFLYAQNGDTANVFPNLMGKLASIREKYSKEHKVEDKFALSTFLLSPSIPHMPGKQLVGRIQSITTPWTSRSHVQKLRGSLQGKKIGHFKM
jgi:hypothetical protein